MHIDSHGLLSHLTREEQAEVISTLALEWRNVFLVINDLSGMVSDLETLTFEMLVGKDYFL